KVNGVAKNVLFFGGGYDPKHETPGYVSPTNDQDSQGNQLYIVDMETGAILWWASSAAGATMTVPDMKWSIPSQVKLFDANNDGFVDSVYFGDLGGQVFRLDIDNGNTGNSGIGKRVQLLAKIGQTVTADTLDQRRFYEPAGVAQVLDPATNQPYVVVAMGTGYRSHPLDVNTQDYFYVFNDRDALRSDLMTLSGGSLQATITPSDLATLDLTSAAGVTLTGKMGWQAALPGTGEKVLSSALVLFGEVFFTTYIPSTGSTSSCQPVIGSSNLWRMSVIDGSVITDVNKDGVLGASDRQQSGIVQGLGGSPELIVGQGGQNAILAGTGVSLNKQFAQPGARRIRWYQKVKQ
ncbi:MAG TPA: PilC/PilY family type IV pilus protein, partial [Aquabacterium sp.]|nr:PilC/PilY family type IV pilus protein [Aquabacterium sp.]